MVYCGAPSKGCEACRQRKIRCDQRPEGCANCEHMNRPCSGYRNHLDLIFRNESREVKRKARAKAQTQASQISSLSKPRPELSRQVKKSDSAPLSKEKSQVSSYYSTSLNSIFNMHPTSDERATAYFFSNYVTPRSTAHYSRYQQKGNLLHSIQAVGLVGIMGIANAPTLSTQVDKEYVEAIVLTNAALSSPTEAKSDSTLLGIIILSIFEAISGRGEKSLAAWENHLRGAAALLKMRGARQMHTPDGRRLFLQITTTLLTSCIKHRTALPDHILDLRAEAEQFADDKSLTWRLHGAMIDFASFRAKVHRNVLSDPHEVISKALELDEIFSSMFQNVPSAWEYKKVYTNADPDIVFSGCYHTYESFIVAQGWNGMRTMRMFLQQMILDALNRAFRATPPLLSVVFYTMQVKASTRALLELQSDILSSIPQHLGYISKGQAGQDLQTRKTLWSEFESVDHNPFKGSTSDLDFILPDVRLYGGYNLLWNVWAAGMSSVTTSENREWTVAILRRIGSSMYVQQAIVLADLLQKRSNWGTIPSPIVSNPCVV